MGHYTIKFGRCPILNEIHHEGTKGTKKKVSADFAEGADGTEVFGWVDQSQYLRLSAAIRG